MSEQDPEAPVVPGLAPADGHPDARRQDGPAVFDRREHGPRILGAADDPDRFDPGAEPALPSGRLDPAQDPDRFLPPGQGQTLPELIGRPGTFEGERDNYQWLIGLACVLGFLVLVGVLFSTVLTP